MRGDANGALECPNENKLASSANAWPVMRCSILLSIYSLIRRMVLGGNPPRQILIYSIFLVPVSTLPDHLGVRGSDLGSDGRRLRSDPANACPASRQPVDRRAARRLFAFSIFHLFLLFAAREQQSRIGLLPVRDPTRRISL